MSYPALCPLQSSRSKSPIYKRCHTLIFCVVSLFHFPKLCNRWPVLQMQPCAVAAAQTPSPSDVISFVALVKVYSKISYRSIIRVTPCVWCSDHSSIHPMYPRCINICMCASHSVCYSCLSDKMRLSVYFKTNEY